MRTCISEGAFSCAHTLDIFICRKQATNISTFSETNSYNEGTANVSRFKERGTGSKKKFKIGYTSKTDTTGTKIFVRYTGVSFTEGLCKPHPLELLGVATRFQCQTRAKLQHMDHKSHWKYLVYGPKATTGKSWLVFWTETLKILQLAISRCVVILWVWPTVRFTRVIHYECKRVGTAKGVRFTE